MSVTVTNCEQILANPCNNSPAKNLYSFSKNERFRVNKPYHKGVFYEPSEQFSRVKHKQVKTTFGVQRPDLFYSKEKAYKPSPDSYTLNTSFKRSRQSQGRASMANTLNVSMDKNGAEAMTTFGVARDAYANVVSVSGYNYTPFKKADPGPGTYDASTKNQKHHYTMRPKTQKQRKSSQFV
jgi:hypothetical protein